jgi:hypothetical protein
MVDALVAQLHCAVLADDCASVARYGRACAAAGVLDQRSIGACQRSSGSGKLVGLPHLLLVYRGDTRVLEAVLERITDDLLGEHASCWCKGGKDCPGGPTALHLAVGQGSVECVRALLRLGADAELPFCFAVDARDVPVKGDSESLCGIAATLPISWQPTAVTSQRLLCWWSTTPPRLTTRIVSAPFATSCLMARRGAH